MTLCARNFAKRLYLTRKSRGISLKALAIRARVPEAVIQEMEAGKADGLPRIRLVKRLSEILGVHSDYLLLRDHKQPTELEGMGNEK
jgi:transcriptional regulator with XRE-family HTH domain